MNFRQRQWSGWAALAIVAALGGLWLLRLDYSRKISSDVLDLIPADERAPELALVRSLASQAEARAMFFVLTTTDGKPAAAGAATRFAAELTKIPVFDQALFMGDTTARDALGHELFEQRFALLFPLWLAKEKSNYAATHGTADDFSPWLAKQTAADLSRFLATPEALAFEELIPSDPLLLMPAAVERLKDGLSLVQSAGSGNPVSPTLVWARLSVSPLSEAGQKPAFDAIEHALSVVRGQFAGVQVAYTGVNRFAAASRARIKSEVSWLNSASLAAVLAVAFLFIRRVYRGLHLIPVVLLATLGAWVCTTAVFDRVHIMVFVVGSLLTGVAIDYGFYLFMQPPVGPGEDYWHKVRRLAKPLLASCLTAVAGFALLLFSELPFIRQLGVFVGSGLVSALAAAVVYFSTVKNPFLEARTFPGNSLLSASTRRNLRRAVIVLWIVALPGLALLQWKDDIRELEIPSPKLKKEDARINALFGGQADHTVYLTYGPTIEAARDSLASLDQWLQSTGGEKVRSVGLSAVVPTANQAGEAVRFVRAHPEFPTELHSAFAAAGFDTNAFDPFFAAYKHYAESAEKISLSEALSALQSKLTGPVGLLLHTGRPLNWFVTIVSRAPAVSPPAATNTISASQLQTLNRIFSRYRRSALWLSLTGLAIVGAGVLLSYGWRDGARIFAIPCGTCLGLFGVLGWTGHPLNLFHLLGAFLGVCLTHNYSIFSATSAYRGEAPPVSVRMSALTTAASFGVLALSGIPVVRALGSTVAIMVISALFIIEFEHLSGLGRKS
jgi:predicted exporter